MDEKQRKNFQLQLVVFCTIEIPGALISLLLYNSTQLLVVTGIAAFMIAKLSPEVLAYFKGEESTQSYPEAGCIRSYGHTFDRSSGQEYTNDHNHLPEDYRDYYEQEPLREVSPHRSAPPQRLARPERPDQSQHLVHPKRPVQPQPSVSPRRTVPLQYPARPKRTVQLQHPVPPRRTAQLQHPVPPRRSAHRNDTWT